MVKLVTFAWSLSFAFLGSTSVDAQDYPSKPIRIITTGAGGGSDIMARQIVKGISGPLGQSLVVENRPQIVIGEMIAKAPPDGYTLLVGGSSLWITPLLRKVPYEMSDFAPITLLSRNIFTLVVHPSLPVKNVKDLIALAKAKPGGLNYAATTQGGPSHLGAELFKSMSGVNIEHVAYKSTVLAFGDLITGQVQMMIIDAALAAPHVKSGKLKAVAITSAQSSALAPGVPTVASSGLPGYELIGVTSMFAPAKTPVNIIGRLNQEVVRYITRPELKEQFLNSGEEIVGNSPEEFAAIIKSEVARTAKVIKEAGIKAE